MSSLLQLLQTAAGWMLRCLARLDGSEATANAARHALLAYDVERHGLGRRWMQAGSRSASWTPPIPNASSE
jgi:hypothetical protein